MSTEPAGIARFREQHARLGGTGEIVILPASVHTAALAAEALGCEVGAIANSLVFTSDLATSDLVTSDLGDHRSPVLILTSGAHRVDVTVTAPRVGAGRLARADADFVRRHTGQVIGGVSPLGHPSPVPTYLDSWLRRHDVVWAAAGHPAAVFSTTCDELATLTGASVIEVV